MYYLLTILTLVSSSAFAGQSINLNKIAMIESSNNPNAIGDSGRALGLYQLHASVVKDYNTRNKTTYKHSQMMNPALAHKVADWYLNTEIPRLLRHYGKPLTIENILTAYNMGIGNVLKGRKAVKYISKYNKLNKGVK